MLRLIVISGMFLRQEPINNTDMSVLTCEHIAVSVNYFFPFIHMKPELKARILIDFNTGSIRIFTIPLIDSSLTNNRHHGEHNEMKIPWKIGVRASFF